MRDTNKKANPLAHLAHGVQQLHVHLSHQHLVVHLDTSMDTSMDPTLIKCVSMCRAVQTCVLFMRDAQWIKRVQSSSTCARDKASGDADVVMLMK